MGTDVRKLVADGYPGANVLGCDLRRAFIDSGYTLADAADGAHGGHGVGAGEGDYFGEKFLDLEKFEEGLGLAL